jgi:hypothetical protein
MYNSRSLARQGGEPRAWGSHTGATNQAAIASVGARVRSTRQPRAAGERMRGADSRGIWRDEKVVPVARVCVRVCVLRVC